MKRLLVFMLALTLFTTILSGCGTNGGNSEETPATQNSETVILNEPLCDGKTLRVLAIGNSFSNDTTEYLYDIATAHGMTEVVIGRLYYGACSIQQHVTYAKGDKAVYVYYKNTSGYWEKTPDVTMLHGLLDEDWDIITLQQASGTSGIRESYEGCLDQLIEFVNENKTNPNAKLVWNMTWAYQSDSTHKDFEKYANKQDLMYKSIVDVVNSVILPTEAFTVVIPAGTAIQNARTSRFGDTLTIDGYHLNALGRVITAYTWYGIFTGQQIDAVQLVAVGTNRLTTEEKEVILTAVNTALAKPFEVTDISN